MTSDATGAVLEVLGRYFSPPIASALLTVTRRREGLDDIPLVNGALARTVGALERTLPSYLADPERRRGCAAELGRLSSDTEPRSSPPASAPDRGPASARRYVASQPEHLPGAVDLARSVAAGVGFGLLDQTKIATAVAELTRNMLQYAGGGELWFSVLDAPRRGVEIGAVDRGPGIPDVERVMSPSYRSRTGMGLGLKGVKRVVDDLEIQSSRAGTRVVLRRWLR